MFKMKGGKELTMVEYLDWMERLVREAKDLLQRRNSTDGDFVGTVWAIKRSVDKLAEKVGK